MSSFISTEGNFRGVVTSYKLEKSSQSNAVAVRIHVRLEEYFREDSQEWVDCRQQDAAVLGWIWVLGRDGRPNERAVEMLRDLAGWDCNFATISDQAWAPPGLQFDVRADVYNGVTSYKIGFLQRLGSTPGTGEEADGNALDAQVGQEMRAIAGGQYSAPAAPAPPPPQPASDEIPW